ncbi:MAG: LLM class flavin-dependent oxidoreductase, partial [Candidatus Nanopelagicales bacterium]
LIGTWGKQTAHLAGQVADEVKIGGTANPLMIPVMRAYLDEGACSVGRDPSEVGVVVGAVTVVDEDHEAARALARKEVAMYLAVVADLDSTIALDPDLVDQVRARVGAGDRAGAGVLIPDNVLDLFAFSGSPEHVAQQVQSLIDAGASRVELGTPQGINTGRGVRLIGERVLPLLRR